MRECYAPGCSVQVDASRLMCLVHWRQLPRHIRGAVWGSYQQGQETAPDTITPAYRDAVKAAQDYLASRRNVSATSPRVRARR